MTQSRTENVVKNSLMSVFYKIVQIIVKFILRTVFIYYLGKEYTGISSLFTDILTVLSLMEMGLDSSMIYSLYSPLAKQNDQRVAALMNFYRKAFTYIGLCVLGLGCLCLPFLRYIVKDVPTIHEDIHVIFLMYVFTSGSSYFFAYKTILIRADQKSRILSMISMVVHITEGIVEIILIAIFRNFFAYLIVHFISTISRNLILSSRAENMYPQYLQNREAKLERNDIINLYKSIGALCVYNLAAVVLSSTDSIFVSAFVGTAEVAIIGNFTLIVNNVRSMVKLVVDASRPSFGNLVVTTDVNGQIKMFSNMNFLMFWLDCFCVTCLFTLLNPFVGEIWLNASYKVDTPILAFLLLSFYLTLMSYTVGTFRSTNGLFVQGWARPAVMSIINIVLDFFLGKRWGIVGIYAATSISLISTQVWFDPYIVFKHVFKKNPARYYLLYIGMLAITIISCGVTYWIGNKIPFHNAYVSFVGKGLLTVIIPNLLVVAIFRKTPEFDYSINVLKKIVRKWILRKK